ncbi:hypothetical protein BDY21DRAFT_369039 [Lineolata rhizophorae]|uniref:Uncharacterized protein n=1 Tax=Lineolata rhizophorae TaxID=578093 RepID=A0A6A6PAL0_9PEZI|nr:hypothetical protein BDY21DRAFT_369039 [Lineolata rhizophorae]
MTVVNRLAAPSRQQLVVQARTLSTSSRAAESNGAVAESTATSISGLGDHESVWDCCQCKREALDYNKTECRFCGHIRCDECQVSNA